MFNRLSNAKAWRTLLAATFICILMASPQTGLTRLASSSALSHQAKPLALQPVPSSVATHSPDTLADSDMATMATGPERISGGYLKLALKRPRTLAKLHPTKIKTGSEPPGSFGKRKGLAGFASLNSGVETTGAAMAGGSDAPFTKEAFEELSKVIEEWKPFENAGADPAKLEEMNLEFFKKVYRTPHAPEMLKLIMGKPENAAKNRALGNLRKWYAWSTQAEYARDHNVRIENTNQGKDNGARSDLDATANILEFDPATGKWTIRDKAVADLIKYQAERYARDGLTPEGVDVTLFNGDTWLPDWRDSRMSYEEFSRKLLSNTSQLKGRKGAYFVPGAHKEQAHDRALAEGHTVHIDWDVTRNCPMINDRPVKFNYITGEVVDAETTQPIQEYNTREMAKKGVVHRYEGVDAVETPDAWRRSLGNAVQNMGEFINHGADPISRNKYFIERVIDQAVGRFTHLYRFSYVDIHGSALPDQKKNAWKKAFIQQAFGVPESDVKRIEEIQSVLDRSSDIQLDKTGKREVALDGKNKERNYLDHRHEYYKAELEEAKAKIDANWDAIKARHESVKKRIAEQNARRRRIAEENSKLPEKDRVPVEPEVQLQPEPNKAEMVLKEAERIFVEKQRRFTIDGSVRVVEETFQRDFSPEGMRRNRENFGSENAKKIMLERGVELALLLDMIETSPHLQAAERDKLRQRVVDAIPEAARPIVGKLAEINGLKLRLVGRVGFERFTKTGDGLSDIRPTELMAQIEKDMKDLLGEKEMTTLSGDVDGKPSSFSREAVRKAIFETISNHLGPVEKGQFEVAWEARKRAMIAKFGASAYWNQIREQADFLMVTGAALGMINAYEQHCAGQSSVLNEECLAGLAWESANQTLYMLPHINTGFMIFSGLRSINEGNAEGFVPLLLGTASLPTPSAALGVTGAALIKLYIAYQIIKLGYAVTIGYHIQLMENDWLEQAFKALPEPGKMARRFNYPNQPWDINRGQTPTIPLLSDVITVDAEGMTDRQRYLEASGKFAPSIKEELNGLGIKPMTDEWYNKRAEIIRRYADLLPYTQRVSQIYKYFGPQVQRLADQFKKDGNPNVREHFDEMKKCLQDSEAKVEEKYKAPPSFWDRVRFWRNEQNDKKKELGQVWSECIRVAAQADEILLKPVFTKYLNGWFSQQWKLYRDYDTPEMRGKLINALTNEYVVKRHMDKGYENERQLEKAALAARDEADMRIKLMGSLLQALKDYTEKVQGLLDQLAAQAYAGDAPQELASTPILRLKAPTYAVRFRDEAPIDFLVRGQYYRDDKPGGAQKNTWLAAQQSEIVGVTLDKPSNLVMTKELEQELRQTPGEPQRKFVTVDEKVTGELRDGTGSRLASSETTVRYYDLLPKWKGKIKVEVLAADSSKVKNSTGPMPYAGAKVKLGGAAEDEKDSDLDGAKFDKLPAGRFTIHVEPKPGDKRHKPADDIAELIDYVPALGWVPKDDKEEGQVLAIGRSILVRWKDAATVTVVLQPEEVEGPTDEVPDDIAKTTNSSGEWVLVRTVLDPQFKSYSQPILWEQVPCGTITWTIQPNSFTYRQYKTNAQHTNVEVDIQYSFTFGSPPSRIAGGATINLKVDGRETWRGFQLAPWAYYAVTGGKVESTKETGKLGEAQWSREFKITAPEGGPAFVIDERAGGPAGGIVHFEYKWVGK